MPDFTPDLAGRVIRLVLFAEWRDQLAAGFLSLDGLHALRGRLDATSGEFAPGPDLDLLALDLDAAIAAAFGCDVSAMPGRGDMAPDTPG